MNRVMRTHDHDRGCRVALVLGDITTEEVDAIVNAANSQLQHGGGVAAAISRRGGPSIQEESNRVKPVPVGGAKETTGGDLPAKVVIHTVGPRWGEGDEDAKLVSAIRSSLTLAARLQLASVSLPAISTGIFGFPLDRAAGLILGEIRRILDADEAPGLREVRLCLFDEKTLAGFERAWPSDWM